MGLKEKRDSVKEKVAAKRESVREKVTEKKEAFKSKLDELRGSTNDDDEPKVPESTVVYVNLLVVDKDEAIKNKVGEKLGEKGATSSWLQGVTGSLANKLVTENVVAGKVADELCSKMPEMMSENGIEANVRKVYKLGSFVVLRLEITAIDVDVLFATKAEEKNPAMAKKVKKLQKMADVFGVKDKLNTKLESTIKKKMRVKLQEKIPEQLTSKFAEQGMIMDVEVNDQAGQPEFFYDIIARLGLAGSAANPNVSTDCAAPSKCLVM